jgi:uncharacterized protein YndB with AHSA1/START domain
MVKTIVTVRASVNAPIEKVWKNWITPESITKWNNATPDWHTPRATNDFRKGGKFSYRMEAKDGSMGFDFEGTYDRITENKQIDYTIADGRKVKIGFTSDGTKTEIIESFEAENINSIEMQRNGWQSIMDNFKKYSESPE